MTGECKYCGKMRIVAADIDSTVEELNELASEDCDCNGASLARKLHTEAEVARVNIDNLFENEPETAAILKEAIEPIQNGKIRKITIAINSKTKASLNKTNKDSLIVNRTTTLKEDLDTE